MGVVNVAVACDFVWSNSIWRNAEKTGFSLSLLGGPGGSDLNVSFILIYSFLVWKCAIFAMLCYSMLRVVCVDKKTTGKKTKMQTGLFGSQFSFITLNLIVKLGHVYSPPRLALHL